METFKTIICFIRPVRPKLQDSRLDIDTLLGDPVRNPVNKDRVVISYSSFKCETNNTVNFGFWDFFPFKVSTNY